MRQILKEIQDGTFASEFLAEMNPNGGRKTHFLAMRRMAAEHPIEKVGAQLRSMMSWLKSKRTQGTGPEAGTPPGRVEKGGKQDLCAVIM